jgi:3-dehydroquinate synthase
MSPQTETVTVPLGERQYTVRIGPGVASGIADRLASLNASQAVVLADSTVAALHSQALLGMLEDVPTTLLTFPAGETNKTLDTYRSLMDQLLSLSPALDRRSVIVTLGGGVTGDMGGFLAATALRGIPFIQCATSLLAAVDASVGGKTGVDTAAGKNLVGAFHQPAGVFVDTDFLATLPAEELDNGLAECVKHGVIRNGSLLGFIDDNAAAIRAMDSAVLTDLIARNVAIKAAVVVSDEREAGVRAHLNFGHTIGHALETFFGYDTLSHGQAVSLGMVAANAIAVSRGLFPAEQADRVKALLTTLDLPARIAGIDAAAILDLMQHDKKTLAGQVRMILPVDLGAVVIVDDITPDDIALALEAIKEG